jgi:PLP dependent protein
VVLPHVQWIHSVDSIRLAGEISKEAGKLGTTMNVLLQVNTSGEESKSGCEPHEISALAKDVLALPHLNVCGLMTIAALDADPERVRPMFRLLRELRDETRHALSTTLRTALRSTLPDDALDQVLERFSHLSMGMSGDFQAAIEEGSTMVRVGTAIFGARQ